PAAVDVLRGDLAYRAARAGSGPGGRRAPPDGGRELRRRHAGLSVAERFGAGEVRVVPRRPRLPVPRPEGGRRMVPALLAVALCLAQSAEPIRLQLPDEQGPAALSLKAL